MSFLFMVGLLAGILYMESEYQQHQRATVRRLRSYCHINVSTSRAISAGFAIRKTTSRCLPLIAVRARDKYN